MIVIDFNKIDSFISEHILKNGIDIIKLSFNDNNYIDFYKNRESANILLKEITTLLYLARTIIYTGFQLTDFKKSKIQRIQSHLKNTFKTLINSQRLLK